jgi:hypothetical protein
MFLDIDGFILMGLPLRRAAGSVIYRYNCCWALSSAVTLGSRSRRTRCCILLSHLGLGSLFVASSRLAGLRRRYSIPPPHGWSGTQSQIYLMTDGQSTSLSGYQATVWDPRPTLISYPWNLSSDSFGFVFLIMRRHRLCDLVIIVHGCRPRGLGFDSLRYHIFWVAEGLERGPLSLMRINEELLEKKIAAPV